MQKTKQAQQKSRLGKIILLGVVLLIVIVGLVMWLIQWNQKSSLEEIAGQAKLESEFNQHNQPTATVKEAYTWRSTHPPKIMVEKEKVTLPEGVFEFQYHDRLRNEFGEAIGLATGEENPLIVLVLSYHNTTEESQLPWDLMQKYFVFDQVMGKMDQAAIKSLDLEFNQADISAREKIVGKKELGRSLLIGAFMEQKGKSYESLLDPIQNVEADQEVQICYVIAPNMPLKEIGVNIIEPVVIEAGALKKNYAFLIDKQLYNISNKEMEF